MTPPHIIAITVETAPCRSRLAGENPEHAAFIQAPRVIVGDHRRQASSYKSRLAGEKLEHAAFIQAHRP